MASNPVFNRIEKDTKQGYAGFGGSPRGSDQAMGAATAGYAAQDQMTAQQLEQMYQQGTAGPVQTGRVTLDDVIMKTAALFAIVVVTALVGWQLAPSIGFPLMLGGIAITLVLGLVIAFKKTISVPLILAYAVGEGVLVGSVSWAYTQLYGDPSLSPFQDIVGQAIVGTLCVFAAMLVLYRTRIIKVTEKFRRIVTMAVMGYALFAVVNFVYAMVTNTPFGIGGNSMFGIGISLFAIGLASFMLALDFDSIENAIAAGAPQKYSWLLAHGLIVTLVWLYLEILRLLGRLRSE